MTESIYNNAGMPSEQGAAPDRDLKGTDELTLVKRIVDAESKIAALTLERDTLKQQLADSDLALDFANKCVGKYMADAESLKTKVERLSAPVSDEEIRAVWEARKTIRGQGLCDYEAIGPVAFAIIAARASTPPKHPINEDEQRRKDAAWNDRPKARCVCGEMIAWYSGEYLHVAGRSKSCADGRLASPAHFLVGRTSAEPEWQAANDPPARSELCPNCSGMLYNGRHLMGHCNSGAL